MQQKTTAVSNAKLATSGTFQGFLDPILNLELAHAEEKWIHWRRGCFHPGPLITDDDLMPLR